MPNVYKIGLTKNSVKQRIQELSTTGVPRPFQVEKVFEISENKLRAVEQLAHKKLKNKDLHHGKEFFEGSIQDCVAAVEDSIYEITKLVSIDLIGQAKQRAEVENRKREEEKRRKEVEQKRMAEVEVRLREANMAVDRQREIYIEKLKIEEKKKEPFLVRFFFVPLGILIMGSIAIAIMSEGGPLAWVGVPLFVWWIINRDRNEARERYMKIASVNFPYVISEKIESNKIEVQPASIQSAHFRPEQIEKNALHNQKLIIDTQAEVSKVIAKRRAEIQAYEDVDPTDWVINSSKSWLFNKKTNELLSKASGLGFSIAGDYFLINNLTVPRKLSVCKTLIDDKEVQLALMIKRH